METREILKIALLLKSYFLFFISYFLFLKIYIPLKPFKKMKDENIELAKEHIDLAKDLVSENSKKKPLDKKSEKEYTEAQFALERAESEIEDLESL